MPSQKASKRRRQEARTPPPPVRRSTGPAGPRRASPKVLIIAGIVVVAIIVAIVLAVVLTNNSSSSSSSTASQLPDATDVQQQFAGIPQNGNVLGKPSAPVTVITYVDAQCPFCRQFETEAMPTIIDKYVRPGKAKVESRVISILGPDSEVGRKAALAAAKQNKMFNFMQLLYDNQGTENTGWLNDDIVKSAAASIPGLDAQQLLNDRNSSSVSDQMKTIDSQATAQSVNQTPTIYVLAKGGKPTAVKLTSPGDPSAVEAAINAAG